METKCKKQMAEDSKKTTNNQMQEINEEQMKTGYKVIKQEQESHPKELQEKIDEQKQMQNQNIQYQKREIPSHLITKEDFHMAYWHLCMDRRLQRDQV
jgi:ADP-ribosylglycohydrolase